MAAHYRIARAASTRETAGVSADEVLIRSAGVTLPQTTKVTPMLRQWLEAKAKAKDAVLLFRMGDFYELFGDDARLAGEVLDLAVTTRDRDKGDDAMPMAGFPHPQAPVYIARLIAAGLKVAVCDQLEDPALARGIVKRDVTRVVTPGMVLEDESLDARANNFLAAVVGAGGGALGVCALDVSTGEVLATVLTGGAALVDELLRLGAREIVVDPALPPELVERLLQPRPAGVGARVEVRTPPAKARLLPRLGAPDAWLLDDGRAPALAACELALTYVEETGQGKVPRHLRAPRALDVGDTLLLDPVTRAHLALTGPPGELRKDGTLLAVVDRTKTAVGGRTVLRRLLSPSADVTRIERRLDAVQRFVDDAALRGAVREQLTGFPDLARLVARAAAGRAVPRDLARLRDALAALPRVRALVDVELPLVPALADRLSRALVDEPALALGQGGVIAPGYDAALDESAALSTTVRDRIAALEEAERKATGIANLKVRYTSVFGFYIEVTRAHLAKVPERYQRKQTVANGERYLTDELAALEAQVEGAEARRNAREAELFAALVDAVAAESAALLAAADVIGELDASAALAEVAVAERWCRPVLHPRERRALVVEEGRHPVVEAAVRRRGDTYVPTSVALDGDERQILIVTGPNMAGKSTMMRQVALLQILAQAGSFVPARKAELSICDRVFTRVGASDDLAQGRSTFMVEMTEAAHILRGATPCSLVLLDEIGRGTSTFDGLSIAWAVAEHLHDVIGARTLFATHYHELAALADERPRIKNVHVVVKEWNEEIVFVRALAEGAAEHSYGIQVARLAGLPAPVLLRAREVLAGLERARPQSDHAPTPQLGLFERRAPGAPPPPPPSPTLTRLRAVEPLRLTPLEAINLLAALVEDARRE
ncbi:MAG: DNA mismatch repair protein MutS [Deltaproteobacteria bacterium]|nr:DNA mismatch repair protein MutS [Deltaproteobacteria bacterium]